MPKTKVAFLCTDCGSETSRWEGQCPSCRGWNTLVENRLARPAPRDRVTLARPSVVRLPDVVTTEAARWTTGLDDFDFVLGGGVVPGSVVLIGGEPGIGKSTLLLQVSGRISAGGRRTLYVSGEESVAQLRLRAERVREDTSQVDVIAETDLQAILEVAEELNPALVVIDSIQTVFEAEVDGVPGSVGQVRECAARLQRFAKRSGTSVLLVGHVTKGGGLAGPKMLEHIVDTVLYFEGESGVDHRVLRSTKNRFGSVDEIGVFRMTGEGLESVQNPSELFLGDRLATRSGCAVTSTMEGSRPILAEIQALATRAPYGAPQRVASGFDHKRLALLLAVLEKRAGLPFGQLDVFINVVGGLRIVEPVADAAAAVALVSTARDLPLRPDLVVLGEVGLGGELRGVARLDRRLSEASRLGFGTAIVPARSASGPTPPGLRVIAVPDISELLRAALG
jgi:DNA repair protein RadA/Sms